MAVQTIDEKIKGDTMVLECRQDQSVVFFYRQISPKDHGFEWGLECDFLWRDSDGCGGWHFRSHNRKDAQIIW